MFSCLDVRKTKRLAFNIKFSICCKKMNFSIIGEEISETIPVPRNQVYFVAKLILLKLVFTKTEFSFCFFFYFQNLHWSDLIASPDTKADPLRLSCKEMKRREAVWELFKSEVIFLVDHLMVLKHVCTRM